MGGSVTIEFRPADRDDVPFIVDMLTDDPLGAKRENSARPLVESYYAAFDAISSDPNNELIVAEHDSMIMGVLQLTYIPYLTYQGSWRALIEGVRIHKDYRSQGLGRELFTWAIERSKSRGCKLVQLTSDKTRPDAIRFYESFGFKATHEGLKLWL
jgi:GNAT superfamily N-acetyltransferase